MPRSRLGAPGCFCQSGSVDVVNQEVVARCCDGWVAVGGGDVAAHADELDVFEAGCLGANVVQRVPPVDGAVLVGLG